MFHCCGTACSCSAHANLGALRAHTNAHAAVDVYVSERVITLFEHAAVLENGMHAYPHRLPLILVHGAPSSALLRMDSLSPCPHLPTAFPALLSHQAQTS